MPQEPCHDAAPQGSQARPAGPGARSSALEPYANNGCNYDSRPGTEPAIPSPRRAWNPRPIYTLSPAASLALGLGDPSSEATAVANATSRGWWTEVADYFDFRTRSRRDGTLGGRKRANRIRYCGRKRAALAHYDGRELFGIGHQGCQDRMCPSCQVEKSREDAKLLRAYFDDRQDTRAGTETDKRPAHDRWDDGPMPWTVDPFLFVTLTDRKEDSETHGLVDVLAQLLDSWRAVTNAANRKRHRVWRSFVRGGMRVVEVTHSAKGKRNRDGSQVKYTGWHPHLHLLIELRTPPAGVSWAEHRAAFEQWLRAEWYGNTRAAGPRGQCFVSVDRARVGQLAKYCVKPFAVGDSNRNVARECMESLDGRRLMAGFGSWKGWRKAAEQLVEKAKGCPATVMLATTLLDWDVRLSEQVEGHTVCFVPVTQETSIVRSWATVRAAIEGDPRTIYQKIAALVAGERAEEVDEAKDRIKLMQQTAGQAPRARPPAAGSAIPPEPPAPSSVSAAG